MIINIRGTHGSGKTTVVRELLTSYPCTPLNPNARGRPDGYRLDTEFGELFVVGSYETACGGCDTIQPYAKIWPRVVNYAGDGHVVFEGALVSNSYGNIGKDSEEFGDDFVFAFLDTPLQTCIDRILERRKARGNDKPFDPNKSVVRIYNSNQSVLQKVKQNNRRYIILNHKKAVPQVLGLLNSA